MKAYPLLKHCFPLHFSIGSNQMLLIKRFKVLYQIIALRNLLCYKNSYNTSINILMLVL